MKITLIRTLQGFTPAYPSDHEQAKKIKIGEGVEAEIKRPRNYQFHKKFFALLEIGRLNTPNVDMSKEPYRRWMQLRAGFFDLYNTPTGEFLDPRSISFANMDNDEFEQVYESILTLILKDTGADEAMVNEMLIDFL